MNTIKVVNMTEFFSRELMLYSLGDLRFRKPKSLKRLDGQSLSLPSTVPPCCSFLA